VQNQARTSEKEESRQKHSQHPAVEPSAQERHGPVVAGKEEGHKNDPRAGAPLL